MHHGGCALMLGLWLTAALIQFWEGECSTCAVGQEECSTCAAGEMPALVATSSSQYSVICTTVPSVGDLHRKFQHLPESCEVLLAVRASSINPADRWPPGPFPQVMGSDISAVVAAVEPTCERLKVGDRVWADIGAVVTSAVGERGKENGAYAPLAVALESQLGLMPKNIAFDEAAALPKVALTSYKALVWYGGAPWQRTLASKQRDMGVNQSRAVSTNTTVLVLGGSGGCGSSGIQLAKALGAATVITTTSANNADYVRTLGADKVIDYHISNWWEVIDDASVDVIYDTVGQKGTGDLAMPKLKSGGHYITIVGALPGNPRKDVSVKMFINSETNLDNLNLLEALRLDVEAEKLRMLKLKKYPLAQIMTAFADSAGGHVDGKLVIEMPTASSGSAQLPDAVSWL